MIRPERRHLLVATCLAGCLTAVTAVVPAPGAVRIVLGVLVVFVLPGFAAQSSLFPEGRLSGGERLLASVGISVGVGVLSAIVLAATPMGLSRPSFGVLLGVATAIVSGYAWFRAPTDSEVTGPGQALGADCDGDIREPH